jgi:hypothetical protein
MVLLTDIEGKFGAKPEFVLASSVVAAF